MRYLNSLTELLSDSKLNAKAYTGCMDTVIFLTLPLVHFLPETGHGSHGNDLKLPLFH